MVYIGCRDCGKDLNNRKRRFNRPITGRSKWNNIIEVCRSCQKKFLDKYPHLKRKR